MARLASALTVPLGPGELTTDLPGAPAGDRVAARPSSLQLEGGPVQEARRRSATAIDVRAPGERPYLPGGPDHSRPWVPPACGRRAEPPSAPGRGYIVASKPSGIGIQHLFRRPGEWSLCEEAVWLEVQRAERVTPLTWICARCQVIGAEREAQELRPASAGAVASGLAGGERIYDRRPVLAAIDLHRPQRAGEAVAS